MDKKSAEILDKLWIEFYMRGEQHEKENRKNDLIDRGLCFLSLAVCACGKTVKAVDSRPNLEGDIKELKDGQLTVVEAITEKSDNGGDIVVSPGSEDDSEFNKIAVTYDEKSCLLYKRSTMEGPDLYCKSDLNHCLPSFDKEKALVRRVKNTTVPAVLVEMGYFSNY